MKKDFYIEHNFIKVGLTSFLKSMDNLFEGYKAHINNDSFPILIMNSGDDVFLSNLNDNGKNKTEHYSLVPRMSLSVGGVTIDIENLSKKANPARIKLFDKQTNKLVSGTTHMRRIPIKITLPVSVVFSKLHEFLTWVEYYMSATSHTTHVFKFGYAGTVHQGVANFIWEYNSEANFEFMFGSDKKERKLPLIIEVEMQFPAFNLYEAKGFNYIENVGVVLNDSNDGDGNCDSCGSKDCSTCGDPLGVMGMNKIIHNMHVNDESPRGIVSTTIIEKKK